VILADKLGFYDAFEETMNVLSQPGVIEKFKPQGIEPMPLTPAEFDALIAKEIESNKAIVKAAGLKFN
jgi:tripartite-type tricarboxylate transporter receptor subunit TctC